MSFRFFSVLLFTTFAFPQDGPKAPGPPAASDEDFKVFTEHPRLLLKPQRLRLLRRERERRSPRWQQFETLIVGKVQMPEPGFSDSLYYQIAGDETAGKRAVTWAVGTGNDLRQLAIVYDWCQPLMSDIQKKALEQKIERGLAQTAAASDFSTVRARALAAISTGASDPLEKIVHGWWRGKVAPALKGGSRTLDRSEIYPLFEMMHSIRDGVNVEMREDAPKFFQDLPASLLLTYYPAIFPAAENDYRIPVYPGGADPDLKVAIMSRAADLSIVSYDSNSKESQFLQGWLIHDKFMMRGPLGVPYEFLWANPYQPGLSYFYLPLRFHDDIAGRLFLRSSWDDDALWLGYFGGKVQIFKDGSVQPMSLASQKGPTVIGDSAVLLAKPPMKLDLPPDHPLFYFLVGLKPDHKYLVEADDEELTELETDHGGILPMILTRKEGYGVRIADRPQ
jgi:hypothetical protein